MSLSIAAVDRSDDLRDQTLDVEKDYGVETATFVVDGTVDPNDDVLIYHNEDLLFGGLVVATQAFAVGETRVEARDYSVVLDRIVVTLRIAEGTEILAAMHDLFEQYLEPKGFTWLSATSGGPTLNVELVFDHQPLSAVFSELAQHAEGFWRCNGLKQIGLTMPGDLTGQALTDDDVVDWDVSDDDVIEQEATIQATRLWLRTGGSGLLQHHEGRIADGTQERFHLNVEPKPPDTDPAVSYAPTTVEENGTTHVIGDGRWAYDADEHAIYVVSGGPPANGHEVKTGMYTVERPAWCRVWRAEAVNADGTWNIAALEDAIVQAQDKTDIVQTVEWGRLLLARRTAGAKTLSVTTYRPGYYPLLQVPVTRAQRGFSATCLVAYVRASAVGIDPETTDEDLEYQLRLIEGDKLEETFRDAWLARGAQTGGGTSVLGGAPVPGEPGQVGSARGWFYLGGNRRDADNSDDWIEIRDAVPVRLGGPALAGTWTLRIWRSVTDSGTQVAVRLRDRTNDVTLASIAAGNPTTPTVATATFSMPATEGLCMVEYQITAGSGSAIIENCSLEGY